MNQFHLFCIKHNKITYIIFLFLFFSLLISLTFNKYVWEIKEHKEFQIEVSYQQQNVYLEELQRQENVINEYENLTYLQILEKEDQELEPSYDPNDITRPSNITVEEMRKLLKGTQLEGVAEGYILSEKIFGINALGLYGLTVNESAYGTSRLAKEKNNISGFRAYDEDPYKNASTFKSKTYCVLTTARLLDENYINEGLKSTSSINKKYAKDTKWHKKINNIAYKALSDIGSMEMNEK